jgi:hypothetical protein
MRATAAVAERFGFVGKARSIIRCRGLRIIPSQQHWDEDDEDAPSYGINPVTGEKIMLGS